MIRKRDLKAEKFAARLLLLLMNEMRASGRRQVVFLCIGTDRSTGDSLGPLIGSRLEAEVIGDVVVIGTLEHPVHAVNLDRTIGGDGRTLPGCDHHSRGRRRGPLGSCGACDAGKGSLRPGLGVRKGTCRRGDISITGIVGGAESGDPLFLQSIRLSKVMRLGGLHQPQHLPWIADHRETCRKLSGQAAPF